MWILYIWPVSPFATGWAVFPGDLWHRLYQLALSANAESMHISSGGFREEPGWAMAPPLVWLPSKMLVTCANKK